MLDIDVVGFVDDWGCRAVVLVVVVHGGAEVVCLNIKNKCSVYIG